MLGVVTTIGQALDGHWTLTVRCGWGKRDGMKSIRECVSSADMDLETLGMGEGLRLPDRLARG
jgi:hypothetical protein